MKRIYIEPSIKVKKIEGESLLAASEGFSSTGDGGGPSGGGGTDDSGTGNPAAKPFTEEHSSIIWDDTDM